MLAAYRKLQDEGGSGKVVINSTLTVVLMILIGINFDLRINTSTVSAESCAAFFLAYALIYTQVLGCSMLVGCRIAPVFCLLWCAKLPR